MKLNFKKDQNTIVVHLKGRLDIHQVEEIEKDFRVLLDEETSSHVVLNLVDIDYVSSSGIGLFVYIMNRQKERGKKFAICNLNSSVKRIMEIVEMNVLFNIFDNENDAVEFFRNE